MVKWGEGNAARRIAALLTGIFWLAAAGSLAAQSTGGAERYRGPYLADSHLERLAERFGITDPADGTASEPSNGLSAGDTMRDRRILFIGNSITLRHDVPARVAERAAAEGVRVEVAMAAADGARLNETAQIERLTEMLQRTRWDVLVLQDHTTTPFRSADRERSERTIETLAGLAGPGRILLYPPWPRAPGHSFYSLQQESFDTPPRDPQEFVRQTMDFYGKVAVDNGYRVAPVPERWMQALKNARPVYDADNYHASAQGADLAAGALWESLREMLGTGRAAQTGQHTTTTAATRAAVPVEATEAAPLGL